MCCGQSEADLKARREMGDDQPDVKASGPYVGLYTQDEGAEIQIGHYGLATNTHCAIVPPEVAVELQGDPRFGTLPRWEHMRPEDPAPVATAGAGIQEAVPAFHAEGGKVYHTFEDCKTANDIETENRREGTGGKRLCSECKKLAREGEE